MRRLFPTQLRIVSRATELDAEEESKKLYYDARSRNYIQIGVNCDTDCLYISSPGNWYKSYCFKLDLVKAAVVPAEQKDVVDEEEEEEKRHNNGGDQLCGDAHDLWRIVAQIIKCEMGRKAIYTLGSRYLVIPHINSTMSTQVYYLVKHVLTRLGIKFTRSSSLFSHFSTATVPDVREKVRRRRNRKRNVSEHLQGAFWRKQ